ncbi:MAG TPA: glucose-6-phosphate dehydrogenase [Caulobacteraceae bacterium]|jgi:glucose-6-phosphate 1-dehydrogenase|nr:glucose-6-phosphate dehydrogenase [Caulobacteraceae bacterium]
MTAEAIVIVGATGDLALRMLFPSLYFLDSEGLLAEGFRIIGAARAPLSDEAFADRVEQAVHERSDGAFEAGAWRRFRARLSYSPVDASDAGSFKTLAESLGGARNVIFYLSTSPNLYAAISSQLCEAGLTQDGARVVVEKPVGHDLRTCSLINDALEQVFSERNIFRIDHYLGKEPVQNLIALRFANTLFEPLWNHVSIEHVQITVGETVGVEGRWSYYNDYGALRDMVQNHVLQLLCLVAMEPPASLEPDSVRNEKVKVLRSLRPITGREVERRTVRGQYRAGVADGRSASGYLDEAGGGPSDTETFVALQANIDNWRWAGVPFYLRTGKRLPNKASQIVIQFRDVPHSIFAGDDLMANRLTIRLQPEEEISLSLMNKTPSLDGLQLRPVALNLSLSDAFKQQAPRRRIAYERLLLEAIRGNQTLFVRRDEVEAAWTWIDAIAAGWEHYALKPTGYAAGAWGPAGAFALTERNGHTWYE